MRTATLAAVVSSDEKKLSGDLSAIQGNLGGPGEKMDFSRNADLTAYALRHNLMN